MRTTIHLSLSLGLCLIAVGCSDDAHVDTDVAEAQVSTVAGWDVFGQEISPDGATPMAAVIGNSTENQGQRMVLTGTVEKVCKAKGCWMTLNTGDESMRVTFKDYGFFVPLDCEGREVVVDGLFDVKELSVEEARHFLEDEGDMEGAAAITEPVKEYSFVADGVLMKKAE